MDHLSFEACGRCNCKPSLSDVHALNLEYNLFSCFSEERNEGYCSCETLASNARALELEMKRKWNSNSGIIRHLRHEKKK